MSKLPANAGGVMELGFAGLKFIQELVQNNKYFVLRIKNNGKLEFESYHVRSIDRDIIDS